MKLFGNFFGMLMSIFMIAISYYGISSKGLEAFIKFPTGGALAISVGFALVIIHYFGHAAKLSSYKYRDPILYIYISLCYILAQWNIIVTDNFIFDKPLLAKITVSVLLVLLTLTLTIELQDPEEDESIIKALS